ncbi:MAG: hypothetical protein M0001_13780 [Treponema sp.]|nr:hypothetical protein [Treponema sp.]
MAFVNAASKRMDARAAAEARTGCPRAAMDEGLAFVIAASKRMDA